MSSIPNQSDVAKKSAKHKAKNELFCKTFALPDTERVVQDYRCTPKGSLTGGKLYVSTNWCCYAASMSGHIDKIPYRKLESVEKEKSFLKLGTADKTFLFSGFYQNHLDEAVTVIKYLWKNPPSYVELKYAVPEPTKPISQEPKKKEVSEPGQIAASYGEDWGNEDDIQTAQERKFNRYSDTPAVPVWDQPIQATTIKVDLEGTKEALRLAREAEQTGAETLAILAAQGEQIDRIENKLDGIHSQLDKSDRLLRDCESLLAYIGNAIYDPKNKRKIHQAKDRSIALVQGKSPPMDIEILYKKADDSLWPGVLALDGDFFTCVNPETDKLLDPKKYLYSDISSVVMRARPEHCDIRFSGNTRFRFMSSYLQIIVNEMVLRSRDNKHEIQVIFEPVIAPFDYGSARVSATAPIASRDNPSGFFARDAQKTSALLSQHASQETRDALNAADDDLDEISNILGNLGNINSAMSTTLDQQNEQLARVNAKATSATTRVQDSNRKIDVLKS